MPLAVGEARSLAELWLRAPWPSCGCARLGRAVVARALAELWLRAPWPSCGCARLGRAVVARALAELWLRAHAMGGTTQPRTESTNGNGTALMNTGRAGRSITQLRALSIQTNNLKTMCPRLAPQPGQQFTCRKPSPSPFLFPERDAEKKVEKTWAEKKAEKKAEKTNKLAVLKF